MRLSHSPLLLLYLFLSSWVYLPSHRAVTPIKAQSPFFNLFDTTAAADQRDAQTRIANPRRMGRANERTGLERGEIQAIDSAS